MAQTKLGAIKVASQKLGITIDEYLDKSNSGLKRCTKCRQWQTIDRFHKDSSRYDGLSAICISCRSIDKGNRINVRLSRIMAKQGLKWCSRCQNWKPIKEMNGFLCKPHRNEYYREKYAIDKNYRAERRQHAHARKRNIDPIPSDAQTEILEEFNGNCAYCGKPADTWDHIIPISKGGKTTPGNVVPACSSCNSSKNNRDLFEWMDEKGYQYNEALMDRLVLAEIGFYG